MVDSLFTRLRRWTTQDHARRNAATATGQLRQRRLEREDANAFLDRLARERGRPDLSYAGPSTDHLKSRARQS